MRSSAANVRLAKISWQVLFPPTHVTVAQRKPCSFQTAAFLNGEVPTPRENFLASPVASTICTIFFICCIRDDPPIPWLRRLMFLLYLYALDSKKVHVPPHLPFPEAGKAIAVVSFPFCFCHLLWQQAFFHASTTPR